MFGILAFSFPLLGGCLGPDVDFEATGSSPVWLPDHAYDGRGAHPTEGTLNVALDDSKNSGRIEAEVQDGPNRVAIRWISYRGVLPFQSGGVATNLELWGATGNGSTEFPRVFAYAAAFGEAELRINGELQPDPSSLRPSYRALFFLTRGQYRDPDTYAIKDGTGSGPYDPARPDNATVSGFGAQAAVLVYSARGELYRYVEFHEVKVQRLAE